MARMHCCEYMPAAYDVEYDKSFGWELVFSETAESGDVEYRLSTKFSIPMEFCPFCGEELR